MSIDVALSTRRDVGRDTYSLPQKRGCAASGTNRALLFLNKSYIFIPFFCAPRLFSLLLSAETHTSAKHLAQLQRRILFFNLNSA